MNLTLARNDFLSTGIFGTLEPDDGSFELKTVEHAYALIPVPGSPSTSYEPKLAKGSYLCVRGMHTLEHHPVPFEAFEITNVPDFQGAPVTKILLHIGNDAQVDSEGCVLLGLCRAGNARITQSRQAFELLMEKQTGVNEFLLTVS